MKTSARSCSLTQTFAVTLSWCDGSLCSVGLLSTNWQRWRLLSVRQSSSHLCVFNLSVVVLTQEPTVSLPFLAHLQSSFTSFWCGSVSQLCFFFLLWSSKWIIETLLFTLLSVLFKLQVSVLLEHLQLGRTESRYVHLCSLLSKAKPCRCANPASLSAVFDAGIDFISWGRRLRHIWSLRVFIWIPGSLSWRFFFWYDWFIFDVLLSNDEKIEAAVFSHEKVTGGVASQIQTGCAGDARDVKREKPKPFKDFKCFLMTLGSTKTSLHLCSRIRHLGQWTSRPRGFVLFLQRH